jgi:3-oxoacyl-[acyl-carrier-protein] synthase II
MRKVVVTGLGTVGPHGVGARHMFDRLLLGESRIGDVPPAIRNYLPEAVAAVVPDEFEEKASGIRLDGYDRATKFALLAANEAVIDAQLDFSALDCERIGVSSGTGMGGAVSLDAAYRRLYEAGNPRCLPGTVLWSMANGCGAHISIRYGLRGPQITYSLACASSAAALGEAYRSIRHGYADAMIVVGAEALLAPGPFLAWHALRTLAPRHPGAPWASCRPFSRDRSGLVLGEGAAVVVLEAEEHASKRGVTPYVELSGYGITSDANHIAQPNVFGQTRAMQQALEDASVAPRSIGYINAHGTATKVGDASEVEAAKTVFRSNEQLPLVSSTKSMHGHLLGAAGALEFVVTVLAVHTKKVPPTMHLTEPDPECDLDFVPNESRLVSNLGAAMSNSFGFGGCNVSLVVQANGVQRP